MEVTAGVASRPVTPERISSMRSSPTSMRLGLEGLAEPRGAKVELRGGEELMSCVPEWERRWEGPGEEKWRGCGAGCGVWQREGSSGGETRERKVAPGEEAEKG